MVRQLAEIIKHAADGFIGQILRQISIHQQIAPHGHLLEYLLLGHSLHRDGHARQIVVANHLRRYIVYTVG